MDSKISRNERGQWFEDGVPVENKAIAKAFDRWIAKADDGRYILRNNISWAYITLGGAPIFVNRVEIKNDGAVLSLSARPVRQGRCFFFKDRW